MTTDDSDISPAAEPAPTPLLSVADVPMIAHPVVRLDDDRRWVVKSHAEQIAETAPGSADNHILGKLGEDAVAHYFNVEGQLDVDVYPDGGDGGSDLPINGADVDVKTKFIGNSDCRKLKVAVKESLRADYYLLVNRIGPFDFRIIGYAPHWIVANAPIVGSSGDRYHLVDEEYLIPIVRIPGPAS
jgi:hypothetical protein